MSVHTENTEVDFQTGSWQQQRCWLYNPVRWELWQTDMDTQHPYELLMPLRHSQCSWSSNMTERRSLQASWLSIRPLFTTWALLSACEADVAVWVKTACLLKEWATLEEWMEVWSGYEGVQSTSGHLITFDLHPCAHSKAGLIFCPWRPHHKKTLHCFFVVGFFFDNIFMCPSETHPSWHVAVITDMWEGMLFFWVRKWIFILGHCWETKTSTSWS